MDFLILLFFERSFSALRARFGIPALLFFILYSGILGLNVKCFIPGFFQNCTETEYVKRLKMIGGIPLKLIAVDVAIYTLFLAIILFTGNWLGIDPSIRVPIFLAAFSFGIFV